MKKIGLLYEGNDKKVFTTEDEDLLIVDYKNDAPSFHGGNTDSVRGIVNNRMTNAVCKRLELKGIPTHYVQELSDKETVVKKAEIIPLEVIVRNVAAGSFSKKLGLEEGFQLLEPTIEFCYKDEALGDPMINGYYAIAIGAASREEIEKITELSFRINDILKGMFQEIGVDLIDFRLEFGRYKGQIILADEISLNTCHLWEAWTNMKLTGEGFDGDIKNAQGIYQEIFQMLGLV